MVSGRLLLSDTYPRDMVVHMPKVIAIHHGADEMHETFLSRFRVITMVHHFMASPVTCSERHHNLIFDSLSPKI